MFLFTDAYPSESPIRKLIREQYRCDETQVIQSLLSLGKLDLPERTRIHEHASKLAEHIRKAQSGKGGLDALLNEFSLSTEEGIVLMCLAEALLRVPDNHTMDLLIQDKLSDGNWAAHLGNSHSLFVNASAWGLLITGKLVSYSADDDKTHLNILKKAVGRLGDPVIRRAVRYALQIMGTQFVMGTDINSALHRARKLEARGFFYSYDMLGEAARTATDARRYFESYRNAIVHIGQAARETPEISPGISVKLSALHPRYEFSQYQRVMTELKSRLLTLAVLAREKGIGFTVDAEEADRLDISLDLIETVFSDPQLEGWNGFGIAVQAYQKRALHVVEWANQLAAATDRKMMVRLVKGAYWDTEIKHAQVEGFDDYPVFTSKPATDLSYQVCAKKLLECREHLYPQFATHNAYSVATIMEMAGDNKTGFEFQRLHGMGEALYEKIYAEQGIGCRIYAPVGEHADLLAYLVRRLLENGANSSFVNNIVDESISIDSLLVDPQKTVQSWTCKRNAAIPLPNDLFGETRKNSKGLDVTDSHSIGELDIQLTNWWNSLSAEDSQKQAACDNTLQAGEPVCNPADTRQIIGALKFTTAEEITLKLSRAHQQFELWSQTPVTERAAVLKKMADNLELHRHRFIGLCIKEAGKTLPDAVAEIREAIDFCRYYAAQAEQHSTARTAKGVILCISPWNFPLAIFLGQISAALVTGNTVLAKPAEQTSLIAMAAVDLFHQSGLPDHALELIIAPGKAVGPQLVPDERIQTVMFTGSTATGKWLSETLAQRNDGPVTLVAETGGQNAMIVDSTALAEQVVDDVVTSGFQSAGQRCSALRVLFLQTDIADKMIDMIKGAMDELVIGDPMLLSTDIGPVIDPLALQRLQNHMDGMKDKANLLHRSKLGPACENGHFFAPALFEIEDLSLLKDEVFGPVVHVIRYRGDELPKVIEQINSAKFGLTLGLHSRIEIVKNYVSRHARVGNVYINRNMIGAVVGVQPFGGQGLSGTGPKAGGALYLHRLMSPAEEHVVTEKPVVESESASLSPTGTSVSYSAPALLKPQQLQPELIATHKLAQNDWKQLSLDIKTKYLDEFLKTLKTQGLTLEGMDRGTLENLIKQGRALLESVKSGALATTALPGPTGETNHLSFESRGTVLNCLSEHDSLQHGLVSLLTALLSGNGVINLVEGEKNIQLTLSVCQWLIRCGVNADLIINLQQPSDDQRLPSLMASSGMCLFDAVVIQPGNRYLQQVVRQVAEIEGAIIPVITDPVDELFLYRFVLEKTVTHDTTASGGNASLMTMQDQHHAPDLQQAG